MYQLQGDAVFPGEYSGTAHAYRPDDTGTNYAGALIVASALTNAVADVAVRSGAVAVITNIGTFACHGANILRAAGVAGPPITWVTHVLVDPLVLDGRHVQILQGGRLAIEDDPPPSERFREPITAIDTVVWTEGLGITKRAYWPHRTYTVLEASIMIPCICDSLEDITEGPHSITGTLGPDSRLWFSPSAPTTNDIARRASRPRIGWPRITAQADNYDEILTSLYRTRRALSGYEREALVAIIPLLRTYFREWVFFHNTYEEAIRSSVEAAGHRWSAGDRVAETLTRTCLTQWLVAEHLILPNRKNLFRDDVPPDFHPPFTVAEDINETWARQWHDLQGTRLTSGMTERLRYASAVFAIKEWKFVINKMLFSAFARTATDWCTVAGLDKPQSSLGPMTVEALLKRLEDPC